MPVRWRCLTQRGGGSSLSDLVSFRDGSFSFEVYPPTNEVEHRAMQMWVTVTNASGNVASGNIEIDPNTANPGHTW